MVDLYCTDPARQLTTAGEDPGDLIVICPTCTATRLFEVPGSWEGLIIWFNNTFFARETKPNSVIFA